MHNKNRILIIESSDSARSLLYKKLQSKLNQIDIIACASAKEALTAVTRYDFNIITTSIDLPDMNGYQLVKKIRQIQKNSNTAIFIISSNHEEELAQLDDQQNKAVTAYFDKSDGHNSLISFIKKFLQKSNIKTARIIYVDNCSSDDDIVASTLKRHGFHIKHFKTAEQGLDFIRQDVVDNEHCTYDLLITDIFITGTIVGYDFIKRIRNEIKLDYQALPTLLLVQEPKDDNKTDFTGIVGAGTNDFLTKPIEEGELLKRIQVLINIKRQKQALNH